MNTSGRRKALSIGVLCTIAASTILLLFQNCQKASPNVDVPSSTNQSSNLPTTTTLPNVLVSANSYAPVRMDQVCNDSNLEKKALINTYIRLLHRCADRPGLDFWYNAQIRSGGSVISNLESGIRSSTEFKDQALPGKTVSDRFCLPGDTFQILSNNVVLTNTQLDNIQISDTRTFTVTCRTNVTGNLTSSQSMVVRATGALNSHGGYVCSVPGDNLRNHIIEIYMNYLDRCPEAEGLDFWAQNWPGDAAWVANSDVDGYLKCRYQNGDLAGTVINTIDACYQSKFNTALCSAGSKFVKTRWCEKTGP